MRALTAMPGAPGTTAPTDVAEPDPRKGSVVPQDDDVTTVVVL